MHHGGSVHEIFSASSGWKKASAESSVGFVDKGSSITSSRALPSQETKELEQKLLFGRTSSTSRNNHAQSFNVKIVIGY